jgi:hypothetical protein
MLKFISMPTRPPLPKINGEDTHGTDLLVWRWDKFSQEAVAVRANKSLFSGYVSVPGSNSLAKLGRDVFVSANEALLCGGDDRYA